MRDVVIVGGGPSGLSAALFLADKGVPVTVIERQPGTPDDPRAATFHPPTLEMLDPVGATAMLLDAGIVSALWQMRDRREGLIAEFDLALLAGETRFPYRLQCEQHKFVAMLRQLLQRRPEVEFITGREVTAVEAGEGGAIVTAGGERFESRWLVGADGGRSLVRKSQAIDFAGFTYGERFLVVTTTYDFAAEGFAVSNYVADPEEWCAVFQVPGDRPGGLWRTVFPILDDAPEAQHLDPANARRKVDRFVPRPKPYDVVHTNIYTVHQRVAESFRRGPVLLVGDAAHVNNPLGGMGMNFGVHDAHNLAEKLAAVIGGADDTLLDRFARQRRFAAANFLQEQTIANKRALEEKDEGKRAERAALLRSTAADPAAAKAYLMRTSMITGFRAAAQVA